MGLQHEGLVVAEQAGDLGCVAVRHGWQVGQRLLDQVVKVGRDNRAPRQSGERLVQRSRLPVLQRLLQCGLENQFAGGLAQQAGRVEQAFGGE